MISIEKEYMAYDNPQTYRQLSRNPAQRYLVVGDLHGRFETLMKLLDKAQYEPSRDVLLSVGDLIDRGPRSVEIINFFSAPGRYAVRGNHEQMVLNPTDWREVWIDPHNGGPATCRSLHAANKDIAWLQSQVCKYPICLDVGDENDPHAFRLVHAEQPFSWSEMDFMAFLETSTYLEAGEGRLLWGRNDIESIMAAIIPSQHEQRSSRRSFCGHTPIEQITEAHNTYWIDTFGAYTLSCIDAVTLDEWSVPVRDDECPWHH